MATKKTTKKEEVVEKVALKLLAPRITEKSGLLSGIRQYTFIVPMTANKPMIRAAFKAEYKKDPTHITVSLLPKKPIMRAGKPGVKAGLKKAVVTLKKGDKIEFI